MNPKIIEAGKKNAVTLKYEVLGQDRYYVDCLLKPFYHASVGVMSVSESEDKALDSALHLQKRVEELEKKMGTKIVSPKTSEQPHQNGYVHKNLFEDCTVSFKHVGEDFYITGIVRKDSMGFSYSNEPFVLSERFSKIKKIETPEDIRHYNDIKEYLKIDQIDLEGGELWEWDDIGFLCGSSGICVIKDGLVLKSLGLFRA